MDDKGCMVNLWEKIGWIFASNDEGTEQLQWRIGYGSTN